MEGVATDNETLQCVTNNAKRERDERDERDEMETGRTSVQRVLLGSTLTRSTVKLGLPGEVSVGDGMALERTQRNKVWAARVVEGWLNKGTSLLVDELSKGVLLAELEREIQTTRLKGWLEARCHAVGLRRGAPKDAFARWCFTCKGLEVAEQLQVLDPLFPARGDSDAGLEHELRKAGLERQKAELLCQQFGAESRVAIDAVQKRQLSCGSEAIPAIEIVSDGTSHSVTFEGVTRSVTAEVFSRLKQRYRGAPESMGAHLWRLLQRYIALGGEGYQGTLRKEVLKHLFNRFEVRHECFASPLNAYLTHYTSAFPETDKVWGSHGSFFGLLNDWKRSVSRTEGGAFEINPPFVEEIMLATVLYLDLWLQEPAPLAFFIFFPGWFDTPAYEVLKASPFTRVIKHLPKEAHSYRAGHAHLPNRQATHFAYADTLFFVCQNEAGAKKWPVSDADTNKILDLMKGIDK